LGCGVTGGGEAGGDDGGADGGTGGGGDGCMVPYASTSATASCRLEDGSCSRTDVASVGAAPTGTGSCSTSGYLVMAEKS